VQDAGEGAAEGEVLGLDRSLAAARAERRRHLEPAVRAEPGRGGSAKITVGLWDPEGGACRPFSFLLRQFPAAGLMSHSSIPA
jgi:hypothetical protein